MLDKPQPPLRARITADAVEVLQALPTIGRLMVTANHLGATHERIGTVEAVALRDGWALLSGEEHDSAIELAAVAEIIVDRSSVMRDQTYPRLDLMRADGSSLCGIVGFGGLEPFDRAIAGFATEGAAEPRAERPQPRADEIAADDPGRVQLEAAQAGGAVVAVGFAQPGFRQAWRGRIEAIKPAMGFINVMRADFHLHLKGGAVAHWLMRDDATFEAVDAAGERLGLTLTDPARLQ